MRALALATGLLLAATAGAFAQATPEQRAACGGDVEKFCKGVQPGGGRIIECLAKQKDKLTDACKKVVAAQGK